MIVIKRIITTTTSVYRVDAKTEDEAIRLSNDSLADTRLLAEQTERDLKLDILNEKEKGK